MHRFSRPLTVEQSAYVDHLIATYASPALWDVKRRERILLLPDGSDALGAALLPARKQRERIADREVSEEYH